MDDIKENGLNGFDLNSFARYIYGGFLLVAVVLHVFRIKPESILGVPSDANGLLLTLAVVGLGTGFYPVYKVFIGECLINSIHFFRPQFLCRHRRRDCVFAFIVRRFQVDSPTRGTVFTIYRMIRDKYFRGHFFKRHSEIHVLYETATIMLLASLAVCIRKLAHSDVHAWELILYPCLFILSAAAGFVAESMLCREELAHFSRISATNGAEIVRMLSDAGLTTTGIRAPVNINAEAANMGESRLIAGATVVMAIATVVGVAVAASQWDVIHKQLLTEVAGIGVELSAVEEPAAGKPFEVRVLINNYGKTSALDVKHAFFMQIYSGSMHLGEWEKGMKSKWNIDDKDRPTIPIFPGVPLRHPIHTDLPLSAQEASLLKAGAAHVVIWGDIEYKDVFGGVHLNEFCSRYELDNKFTACSEHNKAY